MNYSDYLNLSKEELAYMCLCRESKPVCRYDEEVYRFLKPYAYKTQEHFFAIATDNQHRVVDFSITAIGTNNRVTLHPRDIFRPAIMANAHQIILAHNHPSGSPFWSDEDLRTTAKFVACGKILNIGVVDHILIYGDSFSSLASFCEMQNLGVYFDDQGNLHSNEYTLKLISAFDDAEKAVSPKEAP